ncbi:MAG: hypothetical protein LC687_07685 [Actinobacteria bacterium]|nr:hypothetical protein [Actinomycetota bacterium]
MAIAFVRGTLTRDPFVKFPEDSSGTAFAACSVKETYTDRKGEERLGGYHDVIAFGEDAQRLALLEGGDELEVKASIRYRADKRFEGTNDRTKNPFTAQFVVMEFLEGTSDGGQAPDEDEDPFPDA